MWIPKLVNTYMHVCIHELVANLTSAWASIYTHISAYTRTSLLPGYTYTRVYALIRAYTRISRLPGYGYTRTYTHMHAYTHIYTRIFTHLTFALVCIYTHIHSYTRIYTHIHVYTLIFTHRHLELTDAKFGRGKLGDEFQHAVVCFRRALLEN